jgi:hypothetical protein
MPKREEIKIRESTNLYDLLDDGIENGSDSPALAELRRAGSPPESPRRPSAPSSDIPQPPARRSIGGALLGLSVAASGFAVAFWPREMIVWHARIRYLPSIAEHVSATTARGYGVIVAAAGALILAVSLVRMRVPRQRT